MEDVIELVEREWGDGHENGLVWIAIPVHELDAGLEGNSGRVDDNGVRPVARVIRDSREVQVAENRVVESDGIAQRLAGGELTVRSGHGASDVICVARDLDRRRR